MNALFHFSLRMGVKIIEFKCDLRVRTSNKLNANCTRKYLVKIIAESVEQTLSSWARFTVTNWKISPKTILLNFFDWLEPADLDHNEWEAKKYEQQSQTRSLCIYLFERNDTWPMLTTPQIFNNSKIATTSGNWFDCWKAINQQYDRKILFLFLFWNV